MEFTKLKLGFTALFVILRTNDWARIWNGRTNSSPVHRNSILYCTARTARTTSLRLHQYPCPDDRIHQTGARISRTDWHFKSNGQDRFGFGRVELKIGRHTLKLATLDCSACVLAQSVGHASGYNEPGRNLKGFSLVKVWFRALTRSGQFYHFPCLDFPHFSLSLLTRTSI